MDETDSSPPSKDPPSGIMTRTRLYTSSMSVFLSQLRRRVGLAVRTFEGVLQGDNIAISFRNASSILEGKS